MSRLPSRPSTLLAFWTTGNVSLAPGYMCHNRPSVPGFQLSRRRAEPVPVAQPERDAKHTHPHRTPHPGLAGYGRSTHTNTHALTARRALAQYRRRQHKSTPAPPSQPVIAGSSRNPHPGTHRHTAYPGQDWRAAGGALTQTHTPQHPSQDSRGESQSPNPHTRIANPSWDWRATGGARIQTHTPEHPSQELRGAAKTQTQAHTPRQHTGARNDGVSGARTERHTP